MRLDKSRRAIILWLLVAAVLAVFPVAAWAPAEAFSRGSAYGYCGLPRPGPQGAERELNDLSSPDQLRQLFQSDRGKIRIVALLSPT